VCKSRGLGWAAWGRVSDEGGRHLLPLPEVDAKDDRIHRSGRLAGKRTPCPPWLSLGVGRQPPG
jgi:hypothetical protein